MNKKRLSSIATAIVALIFIAAYGQSVYRGYTLSQQLAKINQQSQEQDLPAQAELLQTFQFNLAYTGAQLNSVPLTAMDNQQQLDLATGQPGVVLYLDEVGCSTCSDEETAFVRELALEYGPERVHIVVRANKPAYARSYVRINSLDPNMVYYDPKQTFAKTNQLAFTPMLLLHDGQGQILKAHIPSTGVTQMTQVFHEDLRRFFANEHGQKLASTP